MLRILGKRQSINVRKVLWTCDEIGVPYLQEAWGIGTRSTAEAGFLALSPKALVPVVVDVVVDGDKVLTESNTIVRYLAAKYARADLLPSEPLARARVEEIMDWQATELNWSWRVAFKAIVRKNGSAGTPAQIANSLAEWARLMCLIEQQLADGRHHICAESFTVADIVLGLSVNRWFQTPIQRPELPAVRAYLDRLIQRPAARTHLGGDTD